MKSDSNPNKKIIPVKSSDWEQEEPTQSSLPVVTPSPSKNVAQLQPPLPLGSAKSIKKNPDLGPLQNLFTDPQITEILVNGLNNVLVEKSGQLYLTPLKFSGLDELNRIIRNILDSHGGYITPDHPYHDGALPDGSRFHIIAPPLTADAPYLSIRRFPETRFSIDDLIKNGTVTKALAHFLKLCVKGRVNILISGGTSSGKTTVLNCLLNLVSPSERIITIEDTPELQLEQSSGVRLYSKLQSPASPAVTARDLIANCLRMRPDRIIVGECRRNETLDMLQAMNTGHAGSMTTVHSNSVREAVFRLESLCMLGAANEFPLLGLRRLLLNAIAIVIQVQRLKSGQRKVVHVAEITGIEGEVITFQDIFTNETPDRNQPGLSEIRATGLIPPLVETLESQGIAVDRDIFEREPLA